MQDILVALCVGAALYFVIRILWSKGGNPGNKSGCCGCSGCPNRSPLRDGTCANSAQPHKKPDTAQTK